MWTKPSGYIEALKFARHRAPKVGLRPSPSISRLARETRLSLLHTTTQKIEHLAKPRRRRRRRRRSFSKTCFVGISLSLSLSFGCQAMSLSFGWSVSNMPHAFKRGLPRTRHVTRYESLCGSNQASVTTTTPTAIKSISGMSRLAFRRLA